MTEREVGERKSEGGVSVIESIDRQTQKGKKERGRVK